MFKRILSIILVAACPLHGFAQEAQINLESSSKDQKSLAVWVSGSGINICSAESDKPLSCVLKEMPKKVGKVTSVVSGNFVPQAGASWLVQSNQGSNLCAIDANKNRLLCGKIQTANLQGLTITGSETTSDGLALPQLKFSNQLNLSKDIELILKSNFLLAFKEAKEKIQKSLTESVDDSENYDVETTSESKTELEVEVEDYNAIFEDVINDNAFANGAQFPSTTKINSACSDACTAAYNRTSGVCRGMGNPRARAICWAAAATAYGVCLARC